MTQSPEIRDIIVIGGGISGLSAAWGLIKAGRKVTLIEAHETAGGVIGTVRDQGWQIETGPNTLMVKPALYGLLNEIGLMDEAALADRRSARRYVVSKGRLTALPSGLGSAITSPLMRPVWKYLLREPFVAPSNAPDETIADFVRRRLGPDMLKSFVDPFVSGVFGGDPERLSVRAALPKLAALEAGHGSLFRGAMAKIFAPRPTATPLPKEWRGAIVSFPAGLATLPHRLAKALSYRAELVLGSPVTTLAYQEDQWRIEAAGRVWHAPDIVLATPSYVSAKLLAPLDQTLAQTLEDIPYAPMVSLSLGFNAQDVAHPLDGFGVLIPRSESRRTLGALFPSTLFPGRAPAQGKLISAFIGGRLDSDALSLDDEALRALVLPDLSDILGISAPPIWSHITRWKAAIPQYEIGHGDRMAEITRRTAALPGLHLIGNWQGGVSMTDCITNGLALADYI